MEAEKEQKTRKLLAYSRWQLDANDKFYEAVGLPASEEYAGEYLTWMSEQMSIKQEQKPLEYFERMLPSYDEYVRERYPENLESEHGLSEQESEISICQQNDDMEVDIIGQGESKEPTPISDKVQNPASDNLMESQAMPQLPDSFFAFKSLPVSTQSQLLCAELCDNMQVFEQLQQYAKDTGYQGSFDELYEMASAISEENIRSYEEIKAQMIADELIRAGATAQNFYQIKTDSLVEILARENLSENKIMKLLYLVEQYIGVEFDFGKNFEIFKNIAKTYSSRDKEKRR